MQDKIDLMEAKLTQISLPLMHLDHGQIHCSLSIFSRATLFYIKYSRPWSDYVDRQADIAVYWSYIMSWRMFMLSMLGKNSSRLHFAIYFLIFSKNRI